MTINGVLIDVIIAIVGFVLGVLIAEICYSKMKNVIKTLFEKWVYKHEWETLAKVDYTNGCRYLFACKKCGKMKSKFL